ncbi:lysozyme [Dyella sp.]|uniref:lysozyme n=1 Tax=Dyella sp. TaxID=1869338 RepID=UPI002B4A7117|nr:hypothetical protein [Dyella sp.]HKT27386.1 hypothetical protein [Dyella sp.]
MANENMRMSPRGYTQLQLREGVRMHYYNDMPVNGNCTWGVGTLAHYGPCTEEELRRTVLESDVNAVLSARVMEAERIVKHVVTDHALTQEQFDAAVSFAYNSRTHNIRDALSPANTGNMNAVADQMMQNVYITPRDPRGMPSGNPQFSRGLYNWRLGESQPFRSRTP